MNILPMSESNPNELGYVLPHYSPVYKMGNDYKSGVYIGTKVSRGNCAIACRHLCLPSEDLHQWMGHFALMTPEQLL